MHGNRNMHDAKELKRFGVTLFIAFIVLGGILIWRKAESGFIILGIALPLGILGIVKPTFLGPIYWAWMKMAGILGFITTHLILTLMYYLVFTPIGLLLKIVGKAAFKEKFDPHAGTYWVRKDRMGHSLNKYEKMF